jgi:hypothetical protein
MNDKPIRDHIANPSVRNKRYELYKAAIERFNVAMKEGFYLEATTIIESILTDRMESRIGELTKEPQRFDTIGNLFIKIDNIESNTELKKLWSAVKDWGKKRNETLHEVVKIAMINPRSWESHQTIAKKTAEDGNILFSQINNLLKKERRVAKKNE